MRTIRKTTKKLAAFLLTGLLATTSLAGCGKDADDKTEQGATVNTPAANSPATVSTANAENTSEDNTSEEPVKVRHLVIGTGGTGPAPFIWTDEKGNLQGYVKNVSRSTSSAMFIHFLLPELSSEKISLKM